MLWAALLLSPSSEAPPSSEALLGTAMWCSQFGPRVALGDQCVLTELASSCRLFGGKRELVRRVREESASVGVEFLAWAPTSLGALALARAGVRNGFSAPLSELLDKLPLQVLSAAAAHAPTLERLGCRTLGDVRALPRGGLSRRFGAALLAAMDQAYGLRAEVHSWIEMPQQFAQRHELMARVESAPAMLFGARRLLAQMSGWLAARRCGVQSFTLRWCHDSMRSRAAGDGGEITIRTAEATRNVEHLCRLLAEHLVKVTLEAPVGDLELVAGDVLPLEEVSASLLPDTLEDSAEPLHLVLERIAARAGPDNVLRPVMRDDHRVEWTTHWQPAGEPLPKGTPKQVADGPPQPTFILDTPLKLAVKGNRPMYQGPLFLLTGPHRVEAGWWHRLEQEDGLAAQTVVRDYWVALSDHAAVLWVFQTRAAQDATAWFLHGVFA